GSNGRAIKCWRGSTAARRSVHFPPATTVSAIPIGRTGLVPAVTRGRTPPLLSTFSGPDCTRGSEPKSQRAAKRPDPRARSARAYLTNGGDSVASLLLDI